MESTLKWYESPAVDCSVIISSRVRLARNLKKYHFPTRLSQVDSAKMIGDIKSSLINERTYLGSELSYIDLTGKAPGYLNELMERHAISLAMVNKKANKSVILNSNETIAVMLNEEDHARIQTIYAGENIENAFEMANRMDDLIGESIEYAFDSDFGYLTACPTNTGTGLRASYMLHLPILEASGNLASTAHAISKIGFTIRGIHGEGSKSMGGIYQISNQNTLGKTEAEIINSLKNLTNQIIEKENAIRDNMLTDYRIDAEDRLCRAYGILTNCRKISLEEAMKLLSEVRLGYLSGVYRMEKPKKTIYNIMMDIQPYNLQRIALQENANAEEKHFDALRADYIRNNFA